MPMSLEYRLDRIRKHYAKTGMWISAVGCLGTIALFITLDRWTVHSGKLLSWWAPVVQTFSPVFNAWWFVRSFRDYRHLSRKWPDKTGIPLQEKGTGTT